MADIAKEKIHPIILKNKKDRVHWFDKDGNYCDLFRGIDGNFYMAVIEPKDWRPEVWDLYEKEGITLEGPTPIEEIHYPEKSSE